MRIYINAKQANMEKHNVDSVNPYFNGDKTPVPPHKKGSLGRYNQLIS